MMRTRRHAPVDSPLQGREGMLDGIRRKGRLSIDREAGLAAKPAAHSPWAPYPDVEVGHFPRFGQRVGRVKGTGEGGERREVGANRQVERAKAKT